MLENSGYHFSQKLSKFDTSGLSKIGAQITDKREKQGLSFLKEIINNTFPTFANLTDPSVTTSVQDMAETMLRKVGDIGFFQLEFAYVPEMKVC